MAKYLGENGLLYLWGKIKNFVGNYVKISNGTITINGTDITPITDISGKQNTIDSSHKLSADLIEDGVTNVAYTSTEHTKLSGISAGAEVNQNAFSNVKVGSTTIAADAKTDTLELVAGGNVTLTPDATDDKVTIAATVPTKTSDLTNDSGFITSSDVPEGAAASTTTPKMDGTAATGSETAFSRGDHVHPSDTSKADKSATVSTVTYDTTNKKITKTINGSTTDVVSVATIKTDLGLAKGDVGLGNVDNKSSSTIRSEITSSNVTTALGFTPADASTVGAASGICPLNSSSKIDSTYLPSYVDDVIEAYIVTGQTPLSSTWLATGSASGTVITPEAGKIYVLMNSSTDYPENTQFRWGGSAYVKLNDGGIAEMTTTEMDTATNDWA